MKLATRWKQDSVMSFDPHSSELGLLVGKDAIAVGKGPVTLSARHRASVLRAEQTGLVHAGLGSSCFLSEPWASYTQIGIISPNTRDPYLGGVQLQELEGGLNPNLGTGHYNAGSRGSKHLRELGSSQVSHGAPLYVCPLPEGLEDTW